MIKLRYLLITFLLFSVLDGQEILKDGEKPTSFSYEEAVEMLKARDAEWEAKVKKLKEKVYVDSLIIVA